MGRLFFGSILCSWNFFMFFYIVYYGWYFYVSYFIYKMLNVIVLIFMEVN